MMQNITRSVKIRDRQSSCQHHGRGIQRPDAYSDSQPEMGHCHPGVGTETVASTENGNILVLLRKNSSKYMLR